MSRRLVARFAACAAVLALAIPATASAPVGQYDTFNQFNVTITDAHTALQWERGFATATSWDDARTRCNNLALAGLGAGQWRLPSVKELLTLVDEAVEVEYVTGVGLQYYAIDRRAFRDTPSASFWAWPKQPTSGKAWYVDFSSGESSTLNASNSGNYVRCVH